MRWQSGAPTREIPAEPFGAEFVGRDPYMRTLMHGAERARSGQPGTVVLHGEAGIGKTALARRVADRLADFTVLWACCAADEQDLPFGAVEQLLRRVAPSALPVAGGRELLSLLTDVERSGPVAIVVDALQWIDAASAAALNFVLRRLLDERILVVATYRTEGASRADGAEDEDGADSAIRLCAGVGRVRWLRLDGLTEDEIAHLAEASGLGTIHPNAVSTLGKRTKGHPLHLKAIMAQATAADLRGAEWVQAVPGSLAASVRNTLIRLDPQARALLEALAVLDARAPLAAVARLAEVPEPDAAVEAALATGLLQWWPGQPSTPVRMSHPLHRDAVYQSLTPLRRRRLHAAAVPLVDREAVWAHRVAATGHLDPELAAELEAEAGRALIAGRADRAGRLLLWAADLSADRAEFERRMLTGLGHISCPAQNGGLLQAVERCAPGALRSYVLGRMADARAEFGVAEFHLRAALAAADAAGDNRDNRDNRDDRDDAVVAQAARSLVGMYLWQERIDEAEALSRRFLAAAPSGSGNEEYARFALTVVAGFTGGGPAGLRTLAEFGVKPDPPASELLGERHLLTMRGLSRGLCGQLRAGCDDLAAVIAGTDRREVGVLPYTALALLQYLAGAWDEAATNAGHAVHRAGPDEQSWGVAEAHSVAALVAGSRGDRRAAEDHLDTAGRSARRIGLSAGGWPAHELSAHELSAHESWAQEPWAHEPWTHDLPDSGSGLHPWIVRALLADLEGVANSGVDLLGPLLAPPAHGQRLLLRPLWMPAVIGALIETRRLNEVPAALDGLRALAEDCPPLGLAVARLGGRFAEARGEPWNARTRYESGLEAHYGGGDLPLQRAMLEHALGRLLMTGRDRRAAARWLGRAHDRFRALGAVPGRQRTARDLETLGVRPRTPARTPAGGPADHLAAYPADFPADFPADRQTDDPVLVERLTDRERTVAGHAARGLTNPEIAKVLSVSAKTVEYHLGHVYAKLGLRSRRQLRDLLAGRG